MRRRCTSASAGRWLHRRDCSSRLGTLGFSDLLAPRCSTCMRAPQLRLRQWTGSVRHSRRCIRLHTGECSRVTHLKAVAEAVAVSVAAARMHRLQPWHERLRAASRLPLRQWHTAPHLKQNSSVQMLPTMSKLSPKALMFGRALPAVPELLKPTCPKEPYDRWIFSPFGKRGG